MNIQLKSYKHYRLSGGSSIITFFEGIRTSAFDECPDLYSSWIHFCPSAVGHFIDFKILTKFFSCDNAKQQKNRDQVYRDAVRGVEEMCKFRLGKENIPNVYEK